MARIILCFIKENDSSRVNILLITSFFLSLYDFIGSHFLSYGIEIYL